MAGAAQRGRDPGEPALVADPDAERLASAACLTRSRRNSSIAAGASRCMFSDGPGRPSGARRSAARRGGREPDPHVPVGEDRELGIEAADLGEERAAGDHARRRADDVHVEDRPLEPGGGERRRDPAPPEGRIGRHQPGVGEAAPAAAQASSCARSFAGAQKSSSSRKATHSPRASPMPRFRALATPVGSSCEGSGPARRRSPRGAPGSRRSSPRRRRSPPGRRPPDRAPRRARGQQRPAVPGRDHDRDEIVCRIPSDLCIRGFSVQDFGRFGRFFIGSVESRDSKPPRCANLTRTCGGCHARGERHPADDGPLGTAHPRARLGPRPGGRGSRGSRHRRRFQRRHADTTRRDRRPAPARPRPGIQPGRRPGPQSRHRGSARGLGRLPRRRYFWAPTCLREHLRSIADAGAGWGYGAAISVGPDRPSRVMMPAPAEELEDGLLQHNLVGPPSTVTVRRDLRRDRRLRRAPQRHRRLGPLGATLPARPGRALRGPARRLLGPLGRDASPEPLPAQRRDRVPGREVRGHADPRALRRPHRRPPDRRSRPARRPPCPRRLRLPADRSQRALRGRPARGVALLGGERAVSRLKSAARAEAPEPEWLTAAIGQPADRGVETDGRVPGSLEVA